MKTYLYLKSKPESSIVLVPFPSRTNSLRLHCAARLQERLKDHFFTVFCDVVSSVLTFLSVVRVVVKSAHTIDLYFMTPPPHTCTATEYSIDYLNAQIPLFLAYCAMQWSHQNCAVRPKTESLSGAPDPQSFQVVFAVPEDDL